jgi:uncharacterized protein (DUF1697 family)
VGTYIAMVRSINVGGRNRVSMADLSAVVSSLGFGDVATYVQSGNLVFTGPGTPAAVSAAIEDRIAADLSLTVPVIVRTKSQLKGVLRGNPFADPDVDAKTIHVTFLADHADRLGQARLEELTGQFGNDRFEVAGREVYLHCPGGYGQTKLNNTYLERHLGATATTRNWRTVIALAGMAGL